MSWLDSMNEQIRLFPNQQLGDICLWVRGAAQGIYTCQKEKIKETVDFLELRKDNWRRSLRDEHRELDEAWHGVLCATIREVKSYEWWQRE
jgi:hypothetical protein